MPYLDLRCKECGEEVSVYCDGDNAMMCPECRSIDCFEEIELEPEFNEYEIMSRLEDKWK